MKVHCKVTNPAPYARWSADKRWPSGTTEAELAADELAVVKADPNLLVEEIPPEIPTRARAKQKSVEPGAPE